jgi:FkbH-like protein
MSGDALAEARGLRRQGRPGEALALLRAAARGDQLDAAATERLGRMLQGDLQEEWEAQARAAGRVVWRVHLLAQCTSAWLSPLLRAVCLGRDLPVTLREAGYDGVLQEIGAEEADLVILLPWTQRLLSEPARGDAAGAALSEDARVEAELALWSAAWERRRGARLIQVGYDWTGPGPAGALQSGASGRVRLIRRMNEALRARLPAGAVFLDLEQISGELGRERFYDARRYHWTKQPFSEEGTLRLARLLGAAIRALTTGPRKVLVLDLDNTLWGGVVGELGPLGVAVGESPDGEAYRAFQRHIKGLAARGVVLAVASKNNPEDAREPFLQQRDMVLQLSDFAAFEAHWEPKARSLVRIAEGLRLGLDSFVFFDDNPAEREAIRQALPEVEVVEVPEDPAGYVGALEASLLFETATLTAEDAARGAAYQAEQQRRAAEASYASLDAYLRSLEMRAEIHEIDEADLQRVVQLLGKTNQFNLTTRRHGEDRLRAWREDPRSILLSCRVADRFGDHGLVAVLLAVPDAERPTRLVVDTLLMSCRVIGRTVEHGLWGHLLPIATARGYTHVQADYLPTAKNAQVAGLYDLFGLSRVADLAGEGTRYEAALADLSPPTTFVTLG